MIACTFVAGWIIGAASLALAIGALISFADMCNTPMPSKQPDGVRDPETGLLYDENGRITGRSWVA